MGRDHLGNDAQPARELLQMSLSGPNGKEELTVHWSEEKLRSAAPRLTPFATVLSAKTCFRRENKPYFDFWGQLELASWKHVSVVRGFVVVLCSPYSRRRTDFNLYVKLEPNAGKSNKISTISCVYRVVARGVRGG